MSPLRSGPSAKWRNSERANSDRLADLERFQKLTVGRELRMIELKKEIEDLRASSGKT